MEIISIIISALFWGVAIAAAIDNTTVEGDGTVTVASQGDAGDRFPNIRGPIPVTEIYCTGQKLDPFDIDWAYNDTVLWYTHNKMKGGSVQVFTHLSAIWAVCNCMKLHRVGAPRAEIDHAILLMDAQCGEGMSGVVSSQKWQKRYIREVSKALHEDACSLCQARCCHW